MSESYINTTAMGLTDIPTINFTDVNIGTSINDNFNSINSNFDKILKSEYLRGRAGSNMTAAVCEFGGSLSTPLGILYTSQGDGKIITSELNNTNLVALLKDAIKSHFKPSGPSGNVWLNKLFSEQKYKIVFIVEADELGNKTIVSSLPYNFTDPDLLTNYEKLNEPELLNSLKEFEDKSCVIYFDVNNEGILEAHVYDQIPTIYYDPVAKDFCWKINGEKTGISAKGIPGKQGSKGSSFLLGKFEYEADSEVATTKMQLSHIFYYDESTTDEGKWYNLDPGYKNGTELKTLKTICNLENGSPLMVFGVRKNTTNVRDTKLFMGILRVSNGKYFLAYDNNTCDVGSILSRIDYWSCLQGSEVFFIPNRNSSRYITTIDHTGSIATGPDTHMVGHFFETSTPSNTEIELTLGANIYGQSSDNTLPLMTSVLGTEFRIGTGLPSATKSTLNLNYDKVNCKNVSANRLNIGVSTASAANSLVVHGGDINIKSYDQTDKDGLTSTLSGGNLNLDGTIKINGDKGEPDIIIGNGNGNITTKSLLVLESMSIATGKNLTAGGSASFAGNMWLGGAIGHSNGSSSLTIKNGIKLEYKDPATNANKNALVTWLPTDSKYQFRFSNSYVFLDETSYLHVKGSSGYNGIIAVADITTDGKLKSKKGIEVNVNKDQSDASVKLYCPTTIGNSDGSDTHTIQGKAINLKGNVDISDDKTLTIHGTTTTRDLTVSRDLNVLGLTTLKNNVTIGVNNSNTHTINGDVTTKHKINVLGDATLNSNTTLGNSSSHKHVINGEIIIKNWVATDEMIENLFK